MANNITLPGAGEIVESRDIGSSVKRQVVEHGRRVTYSAAGLITLATSATDVLTLLGSATKTVDLSFLELWFSQGTAAAVINASLIRRSADNSGGTSTTETAIKHDTADGAATAAVKSYTANPTLGTNVGRLRYGLALVPLITAVDKILVPLAWTFGKEDEKPARLSGVSELFAINLNGTPPANTYLNWSLTWTEWS